MYYVSFSLNVYGWRGWMYMTQKEDLAPREESASAAVNVLLVTETLKLAADHHLVLILLDPQSFPFLSFTVSY